MSFQDFGTSKGRNAAPGSRVGNRAGLGMSNDVNNSNTSSIGGDSRGGDGYANVSRGIVQYQVGIAQ